MLCACGFTNDGTATACRTCGVPLADTTVVSQVLPLAASWTITPLPSGKSWGKGALGLPIWAAIQRYTAR
jgi:hypothetical protein